MVKQTTTTKKTKPVGKGKVQCHVKEKKMQDSNQIFRSFCCIRALGFLVELTMGKKTKKNFDTGDKWVKAGVHDY